MNLAKIVSDQQEWQVTLPDGTTTKGALDQVDGQLVAILENAAIDGGTVESATDIVITLDSGTFELAQYLTETLNKPFVQGTDFETAAKELPWQLNYYGYRPGKDEYSVESLLTVGNGFMGLRGTTPEMTIADENYPATYLASLYNTAASEVSGRTIYNEDFVNAPNLQKIYLIIGDETIDIANNQLADFKRSLDLKSGLFTSQTKVILKDGKELLIETAKVASMAQVDHYGLRYSFTPLNFSGEVTLVSEADGEVYNYNVARYRSLTQEQLDITDLGVAETTAFLTATTKQSAIEVTQVSQLFSDQLDLKTLTNETSQTKVVQKLTVPAQENQRYTLEKTVTIAKSAPQAHNPQVALSAVDLVRFDELYQASAQVWQELWQTAGIQIKGDLMSQKMLNLHTYHVLCSGSPQANPHLDASITARGLHGEAYRGHIFWDELFILPFYIIHFPETARELLMYRYRRLPAAKKDAQKAGHAGAMFPWQSGLDGTEQSQELHLNPISGEWKEDHSRLQRHVSLAIAYNVWQYWHNTHDLAFMKDYGLELMLEIAHFWQSLAEWDETTQRYNIDGVMGPDEFHEGYPGSDKGGLKNNAYTNMMVVWLFEEIGNLQNELDSSLFDAVRTKVVLDEETLASMQKIKNQLALTINNDGIIAQFDGYFELKDLDWQHYKEQYGNIYRMDRILNAEGKSADEYKVAKQADSLMIYYNFSKAQVDEILQDLAYELPQDYVEKNLHYYLARTSHGSTLSRVVHAQLAAMVNDQALAWQLYQEALYSDYRDIQGGTTAEGIHAGVMAATLYIPLTTFAGLDIHQKTLQFKPNLPKAWSEISFNLTLRGMHLAVTVSHSQITVASDQAVTIMVGTQEVALTAGTPQTINY